MPVDLKTKISEAEEIVVKAGSRGGRGSYSIGIVNNVNGHRIKISKLCHEKLNSPKSVQFLMLKEDKLLIVAEKLPNATINYKLSINSNGAVTYSAGLVNQITEEFNLDYSTVTSKAYTDVEFDVIEGVTFAAFKIQSDLKTDLQEDTEDEDLAV